MLCPKCGAENPPLSSFCQNCGASMAESATQPQPPAPKPVMSCPKCGAENPPVSKFCQQCGTSLAQAPPPPSPPLQSGSRQKQYPEPGKDAITKESPRLRRLATVSNVAGISLAVVAAIVFFAFVMGRGSGDQKNVVKGTPVQSTTPYKTTPQSTPTSAKTTSPTPTITATTPAGKTLSDMMGLSSNIVSIKYDMLVSGPGIPAMTTKMWLKKNKMRTETNQQGMNVVTLIDKDAKTMYVYMPAQNLAMKMPFDPAQMTQAPSEEAKSILNYNAKVTGTATIDGKVCSVVEYASRQDSVKAWIWQDKGLPVRTEITSSAGKTTIEYKNIDLTDIPDSMFQLPAGVQII